MSNNRRRETGRAGATRTADKSEETTAGGATWEELGKESLDFANKYWRGTAIHAGMAGLLGTAIATQDVPEMPLYSAAFGAVAVGASFLPALKDRLPKLGARTKAQAAWGRLTLAAGSGWLSLAGVVGVDASGVRILILTGVAMGVPWWWHFRPRNGAPEVLVEVPPVEEVPRAIEPPIDYIWDSKVAGDGGPFAGAVLDGWEDTEYGRTSGFWLAEGTSMLGKDAIGKTELVTGLYRKRLGDVVIEKHADGIVGHLQFTVLARTAAEVTMTWPGPMVIDDVMEWDGVIELGPYVDGRGSAGIRLFERGYGVYHSLVTGGTGSGKTGVLRLIIAAAEHSGLVTTWVYEPENNRSLTAWTANDKISRVALTTDEAYVMLLAAEAVMQANITHNANLEWQDEEGFTWKGIDWFDPTPERKMLLVVLDEAHVPLKEKRFAEIVARISKMGRKGGVALVLVTQTPTQDELGGTLGGPIRDNVLMGNIVVLRTKSRMTGMMLSLPFDPSDLPTKFADGSKTSGIGFVQSPASPREEVMFRAMYDETPTRWVKTSPCPRLHPDAEAAAKLVFDNPHLVLGEDGAMAPTLSLVPTINLSQTSAAAPLAPPKMPFQASQVGLADAIAAAQDGKDCKKDLLDYLTANGPTKYGQIVKRGLASPAHTARLLKELSDPAKDVSESEPRLLATNGSGLYWVRETIAA